MSAPDQWASVFEPNVVVALELATRLCHESHDLGEELIERVRQHFTTQQIAELLLVAGQANMYNRAGEGAKQIFADEG